MSNLIAVIGKPISHSRSPELHNPALKAVNSSAIYGRLCVSSVREALDNAQSLGLVGLNVTAPFKEEAYGLVDVTTTEANLIKAVNTIEIKDNVKIGHNTDLYGIIESFRNAGCSVTGRKVLVIGAGGAARAAVAAFKSSECQVFIVNRTLAKAELLAEEMKCRAVALNSDEFVRLMQSIELIVNTASTADRIIPVELLSSRMVILESQYSKGTALLNDAKRQGCKIIDGFSWLLFQGEAAFKIFNGTTPDLSLMREGVKGASHITPSNIALIGMMGSGKTTVAKELAENSNRKLLEIDQLIEERSGKTISQIFKEDGEKAFRGLESEILEEALTLENIIVSCGGGAVLSPQNRSRLAERAFTVLLWASAENLLERIKHETHRPILATTDPHSKIIEVLNERRERYLASADIIVPTDNQLPRAIAQRIIYEFSHVAGIK